MKNNFSEVLACVFNDSEKQGLLKMLAMAIVLRQQIVLRSKFSD